MSNVDRTRHTCSSYSSLSSCSSRAAAKELALCPLIPFCLGYQWGTPGGPGKDTHGTLGPDKREGRGWPEHSSAQQYSAETRQHFVIFLFFFIFLLSFFVFSFFIFQNTFFSLFFRVFFFSFSFFLFFSLSSVLLPFVFRFLLLFFLMFFLFFPCMQLGISVRPPSYLSGRHITHPASVSVVPLIVPSARLASLPSSQPLCFRRLPAQRVDKEGAVRRTLVLEVRSCHQKFTRKNSSLC